MRYTVKCERDESRWWIAQVREVPGCRTQARTLAEVQERIRDALSLFVDDAETADVVLDVQLPVRAKRALQQMKTAREKADAASALVIRRASEAATILTRKVGLSVRDAAQVIGLSHQRVQQLKR